MKTLSMCTLIFFFAILLGLAMQAQPQSNSGLVIPATPDFQCPAGQFVTGFKSGKPTCAIVRLPAMATRPRGYGN